MSNAVASGRSRLPRPLTSFIGRERQITAVSALLRDESVRLVTLTGPGGVGKTRLAIAAASASGDAFPDAVWFVPLASIDDPRLVIPSIATALGVRDGQDQPITESLQIALRHRHSLLVLDNLEHLLDASVSIVELLHACPSLTVLVTSRSRLRVSGEHVFEVLPLPVPDVDSRTPDDIDHASSVTLFVDRARRAISTFEMTSTTRPLVATICRQLDGLPLAIELAAARLHLLSLTALAEQLTDRLGVLAGGVRDAPARLQTMHAAIAWSYDLLSPMVQQLFQQLAIFAGGWTLEAAEAVCVTDIDIQVGLSDLVDHHLVRRLEQPDGSLRLGMLETIRAFARERLHEHEDVDDLRTRHAMYYLHVVEQAAPGLMGPDLATVSRALFADYNNIRAALSWVLESGQPDYALRFCNALTGLWYARGMYRDAQYWLGCALAVVETTTPSLRASALANSGWISLHQAEYAFGQAQLERAISLSRGIGDPEQTARSITLMLFISMSGQRMDESIVSLLREVLELQTQIRDSRTLGNISYADGMYRLAQGDPHHAIAGLERALERYRGAGDIAAVSWTTWSMGAIALGMGDYARADQLVREVLQIATELTDQNGVFQAMYALACIAAGTGDAERAARLWGIQGMLGAAYGLRIAPVSLSVTRYDQHLAMVRTQLGEVAFNAATAHGQTMSEPQAVAYARDHGALSQRSHVESQHGASILTPRETEILRLVATGSSNKQVSVELSLSIRTVERHITNIYAKIGAHNRAEAVAYAFRHALV